MKSSEIRKKFLEFFAQKEHQIIESSSLVPADPTVLFTSAGMQQFIPYLSGKVKPPHKKVMSIQKCFRTSDIDEVGDDSHLTFFEMLGNWSFNDYFKEEAIDLALNLLTEIYGLDKDKISVSFFGGDKKFGLESDNQAKEIWQKNNIPDTRIKPFGMVDNFWGPVGSFGPCGPCSEIYYNGVEIWNLVFMEYEKTTGGRFKKLPVQNIDTGMGLERIASVLQKTKSIFETDLFLPLIKKLEELSQRKYLEAEKEFRIIVDHTRAACFLIADGVLPSKEDKGYVLRRIIRRAIRYGNILKTKKDFLPELAEVVIETYKSIYTELSEKRNDILVVIQNESEKFEKTIERGLKEFEGSVDGEKLFYLYETYGFPLELSLEELKSRNIKFLEEKIKESFKQAQQKHQEISRAGVQKKFGGHGAGVETDFSREELEKIIKLHTATHLLQAALRQILGKHIQQSGSDINPERLRFDFTHSQKLSLEEIKRIEDLVNQKIQEKLEVDFEEMLYEDAIKCGVLAFFKERYPERVKVYSAGDFSKEICGGPHVKNTKELGNFKIVKEESSGAGIRRIKAKLE